MEHIFLPNGRMNFALINELLNTRNTASIFSSRNEGNRNILKIQFDEIVVNKTLNLTVNDYKKNICLKLDHNNVEKIIAFANDDHFFYFLTPLFVDKLDTVWDQETQFNKYDVKKMFNDFLSGMVFMHQQNFVHSTIHQDNLAFNGQNWYISGLLTTNKTDECQSGVRTETSFKSRRLLCTRNFSKSILPSDDLWQLILMYVITYYGFNPFQEKTDASIKTFRKNNTLNTIFAIYTNTINGKCQMISVNNEQSVFGKTLQNMLCNLGENKYSDFKEIINTNTDKHLFSVEDP